MALNVDVEIVRIHLYFTIFYVTLSFQRAFSSCNYISSNQIESDHIVGRYLVATKDIKAGDVVLKVKEKIYKSNFQHTPLPNLIYTTRNRKLYATFDVVLSIPFQTMYPTL